MREAPEVLHTARLVGTRISADDVQDLCALYADPRVMATLSSDGRPWAKARAAELLDRHVEHWNEHGFGTWIFRDRIDCAFVVRAGLRFVDLGSGPEAELFYAVQADCWGTGLATEVSERIIEVGFSEFAFDEIVAYVLPENGASRRVLDKCGLVESGVVVHAGLEHVQYRRARAPGPESPPTDR